MQFLNQYIFTKRDQSHDPQHLELRPEPPRGVPSSECEIFMKMLQKPFWWSMPVLNMNDVTARSREPLWRIIYDFTSQPHSWHPHGENKNVTMEIHKAGKWIVCYIYWSACGFSVTYAVHILLTSTFYKGILFYNMVSNICGIIKYNFTASITWFRSVSWCKTEQKHFVLYTNMTSNKIK